MLAALAGLAAAILKPMIKLNTTLTRLVVLVDELADKLSALEGAQSLMDGARRGEGARDKDYDFGDRG